MVAERMAWGVILPPPFQHNSQGLNPHIMSPWLQNCSLGDYSFSRDLRNIRKCRMAYTFIFTRSHSPIGERGSVIVKVAGQLADKPIRGQPNRGLFNSRTGQVAD